MIKPFLALLTIFSFLAVDSAVSAANLEVKDPSVRVHDSFLSSQASAVKKEERSFSNKTNFAQYYRSTFPVNKRYNKRKKEQVFRVGGSVLITVPRKTAKPNIVIRDSAKLLEEKFFYQPVFYNKWAGEREKLSGNGELVKLQYLSVSAKTGQVIGDSWGASKVIESNYYDLPVALREGMRNMREGENRLIVASSLLPNLKQGSKNSIILPRTYNGDSTVLLVNLLDVSPDPVSVGGISGGSSLAPSADGTSNPLVGMQRDASYPREMFGLHAPWSLDDKSPTWDGDWPNIEFGSLRLWDTQTTWNILEPEKGRFYWTRLDKLVAQAEKNNVSNITLVVGGTPSWAASSAAPGSANWIGENSAAVPREQDWVEFLTALTTRYKGRVDAYQIWNEPNSPVFWQGTPEQLTRTIALAQQTIKNIDPNATIVSPGLAASERFSPNTTRRFWEAFAAGGFPFDVAALHIYPSPRQGLNGFKSLLVHSRDIIVLNGWTGPLWVTETSFWQREEGDTVSPQTVRNLVAGSFLEAAKFGVERMFWYAWMPKQGLGNDHKLFLSMQSGTAGAAGFNDVYRFLTGQEDSQGNSSTEKQCRLEGYCNAAYWDGAGWVVPPCSEGFGSSWGQLGCGEMNVCIREVCTP